MTREDLAKDILLTLLPDWARDVESSCLDPIQRLSKTSVALADALLEALGAKEAPASWLSKEMRTPAKGFPAIKPEGSWAPSLWETVRWQGSRRTCVVTSVNAGPTRSWTLIQERKGERRSYVVKDISELEPYALEEDEE